MKFFSSLAIFTSLISASHAWLPTRDDGIIRGVNLGGLFIVEPWMMSSEWAAMGCSAYQSEFDCVSGIGQAAANKAWASHWSTWITEEDFFDMNGWGINTVRIPLGYWIMESIVYTDSEHFPQGGLTYLTQVVGWAAKYGIYVILDLHGAPGAQVAQNPFTGQYAPTAGFYVDYQFDRAVQFMSWITNLIHTNPSYSTVGAVQVVNEPISWQPSVTASMISTYYPQAWNAVRSVESTLKIASSKKLHIQFMDENWGSGNPNQNLPSTEYALYDYHNYVKYDTAVNPTRDSYMQYSCSGNLAVSGETPLIVGEWSLSVPDALQESADFSTTGSGAVQFFQYWFIAQQQMYERSGLGWIFWNWKADLGDWRWSYKDAVYAGVIPEKLYRCVKWDVCASYSKKRDQLPAAVFMESEERDVAEIVDRAPAPSGEARRNHISKHRSHIRKRHGHIAGLSP